ncbi:hypothetical protein AAFF_G00366090 [Aldrovandia affinis]|uniref:Uncharacterized protein n=1 Tax=Aldrovandia affinis TaxID=143900 RepID=A0AAD7SH74_9TELE|nr:hypothetical protein AAFF_G00366090 [Aldrovandia affinis]
MNRCRLTQKTTTRATNGPVTYWSPTNSLQESPWQIFHGSTDPASDDDSTHEDEEGKPYFAIHSGLLYQIDDLQGEERTQLLVPQVYIPVVLELSWGHIWELRRPRSGCCNATHGRESAEQ